jgi:hypothetical protein
VVRSMILGVLFVWVRLRVLSKYGVSNRFKRNVLNNCVAPLTGLNVFNQIFKDKQKILLDVV